MNFSMRTSLGLIIALTGLMGIALAISTGDVYRELTLERQRAALVNLIHLKTKDLLANLEENASQLGHDLSREPTFLSAFNARDEHLTNKQLNAEFHRYFETAGIITLAKLNVFDANFSLFSESTDLTGLPASASGKAVCSSLVEKARRRTGTERLKSLSSLCLFEGRAYFAVIVPIGGLRATGYIEVVVDPTQNLQKLETELGAPFQITQLNGVNSYVSSDWPLPRTMDEMLLASYKLKTSGSEHALTISMANDFHSLHNDLRKARNRVLFSATITILLIAICALLFMQKTTLTPLNLLIQQMRRVRKDKGQLGIPVTPAGSAEIRELAEDFNEMTVELKELYGAMEKMAFNDALTGLPNRALFNDRLHQIILISQRRDVRFALFMMDLDRFKQINDTFGHAAGDELLQQVAARLLGVLRKSDMMVARVDDHSLLARLGGDEFAIILPMVDKADYTALAAKRILDTLVPPFNIGGNSFSVGISIGIAIFPEDGLDEDTLLSRADLAMYEAKQNKIGIAFYSGSGVESDTLQLTLESELRTAMENNGMALYFQPRMDLNSGIACGAEALLRWQHPERGFISPEVIIPLAERTGLIHPLTQWILDKAVEQCALWHQAGFPISVSVNLSLFSLGDERIVDHVAKALQKWGLTPHYLCLELTENSIMAEPEQTLKILTQLDALEVKLAIDDFGTGNSSLSYLKKQPMDEINIDDSFVASMIGTNNDTVIVHSTISLAHNMNMKVVAKGVESRDVLELLASLHRDVVQGYYLGSPLSGPDFFQSLRDGKWQTTPANTAR